MTDNASEFARTMQEFIHMSDDTGYIEVDEQQLTAAVESRDAELQREARLEEARLQHEHAARTEFNHKCKRNGDDSFRYFQCQRFAELSTPAVSTSSVGESQTKPDKKACSICGSVRMWLTRDGGMLGACTFVDCKDPLYDFKLEHPETFKTKEGKDVQ